MVITVVITVICINLIVSLLCLWVAWRIWRLRQRLARIADVLVRAEQRTDRILFPAPERIMRGQQGSQRLRKRYALLSQQWAKVEQLLVILSWILGIWQRRSRHPR